MINYHKKLILHSVYFAALRNFVLALLLFMLCRVLFWALNTNLFPDLEASQIPRIAVGGLRFDLSALAYGNALWLLLMLIPAKFRCNSCYQKVCKGLFITINSVLLAANCMDFIYFRYTLRRTTIGVFTEFTKEQNYGSLMVWFIRDYWYVFLIWFALIAALVLCYRKAKHNASAPRPILYYAGSALALVLAVGLCVIAMRGSITDSKPLGTGYAHTYVKRTLEAAIVLNTPFSIFRSSREHIHPLHYFSDEKELETYYNPVHTPSPKDAFIPKNVVLIIWESFGRQLVGSLNPDADGGNYKGYTPFIDSLIPNSLIFKRSYANGTKSNEAVLSIAASVPSMRDEPYVQSIYNTNKINSLPSLLEEKGYTSAFFHGCFNGSMRIDECAAIAGFQKYYGKTEYNNDTDYDGAWGIYDEEFLQFFAAKLDEMPQPFCTAVFTQSSHGPYNVPQRYADRWNDCPTPFLRSVRYTDYSLRRFFDRVRHSAWYANTVFVIVADHCTNTNEYPQELTSVERTAVPIIYFAADGSLRGIRQGVTQQSDIMPTVLGLLNYDKPFVAFGRNALNEADTLGIAINYISGVYQVFCKEYVMLHDGERMLGYYNLHDDNMMKNNKLYPAPPPPHDDLWLAQLMERKLKAFIQQYNNRLIENRMTTL